MAPRIGQKLPPWNPERRAKMDLYFESSRGMKGPKSDPEERFWGKVNKSGPIVIASLGPCWIWTGAREVFGYGVFRHLQFNYKAHRMAWFFTHGRHPENMLLHKCDNPPCVNPSHCLEGTQFDNMSDCSKKGRLNDRKGENSPKAKLKTSQVLDIYRLGKEGVPNAEIAERFSVQTQTIRRITAGIGWRHITGAG